MTERGEQNEERRDAILKRMLGTKPEPRKALPKGQRKKARTRKKKAK